MEFKRNLEIKVAFVKQASLKGYLFVLMCKRLFKGISAEKRVQ